ncbi:MAG: EVE domain-containing protein [Candidatus Kapabacteria bacterium]|nr:EVE domain-containing protein [Candidatus Kapabacteria bacterium]
MQYWLIKSEPDVYSWEDFVRDGATFWDGVRNYQARNNLRLMKKGDKALFYHSNIGKEIVGIATVTRTAYQDPTSDDEQWVCVDVKPHKAFKQPVSLETIKATPALQNIGLVRQSRLSVVALTQEEYDVLCAMGLGK